MKVRFFNVKKIKFQWRKIICCRSSSETYKELHIHHLMPDEKVVFKFQVFDERIKRIVKKVVLKFPGVTSVDLKEKYKLKVTGKFDKFEMMKKLKKIDRNVDIIKEITIGEAKKKVNKPFSPIDKKEENKPSDVAVSSNLYGLVKYYGARVGEQINRENVNKVIAYGNRVVGYFKKQDVNKGKRNYAADLPWNKKVAQASSMRVYIVQRIDGKNKNAK